MKLMVILVFEHYLNLDCHTARTYILQPFNIEWHMYGYKHSSFRKMDRLLSYLKKKFDLQSFKTLEHILGHFYVKQIMVGYILAWHHFKITNE